MKSLLTDPNVEDEAGALVDDVEVRLRLSRK